MELANWSIKHKPKAYSVQETITGLGRNHYEDKWLETASF